jgi:hypothetical protein
LRPAVLVVICVLHASLIIVLVRAKLTYALSRTSESITTIYFISPESRHTRLPPVENSLIPHRLSIEPPRPSLPESLPPSAEAESPLDIPAPPAIDWLAEAQRSTAEIMGRAGPERPPSPTGIAPWDPHSQRLEATGHGLKFRIIDRCFADVDLGQTVYGPEERLQLGCDLKKKPARGDLFDSLRKPQTKE